VVALVAFTVGAFVLPVAETNVPSGVVWCTPVQEVAPQTVFASDADERVTTTFAVPDGGLTSRHISIRTTVPLAPTPMFVRGAPA